MQEYVADPLAALATDVFNARMANRYDQHIEALSRSAYMFFSLIAGQTLGEELCSLLPVARSAVFFLPIRLPRKILLAILYGIQKPALMLAARKFFPERPSEDILEIIDRVVLCLLMLFETYSTISHRLLRIRYLSLRHPRDMRSGSGARHTYLIPGLILAVSLLVSLYQFYKARRTNRSGATSGGGTTSAISCSDSDESDDEEGSDPCILCFSKKKAPSSAPCGHVFCWKCITEAAQKDARCPLCREPLPLPSIVPLFFSQPKKTLGSGQENSSPIQGPES